MKVAVEMQDDGVLLVTRAGGVRTLRGVSLARLNRMRDARPDETLRRALESNAPLPIVVEVVDGIARPAAPPPPNLMAQSISYPPCELPAARSRCRYGLITPARREPTR